MSIHSQNDDVILQFGLKKPAFRICVNTPTTHGSIGLTTGLDPAMTLGCGGWGGNITSDNISPRHLLNLKRVAYGIRPAMASSPAPRPASASSAPPAPQAPGLPKAPGRVAPASISAEALSARVDQFLASRGFRPVAGGGAQRDAASPPASGDAPAPSAAPAAETPAAFVCEDDVRAALKEGRQILVGEKTIITPSDRDAGEAARVFRQAGWPGGRP
jgi:acetaldehyde dehydrogenase (acetylating)